MCDEEEILPRKTFEIDRSVERRCSSKEKLFLRKLFSSIRHIRI